ncbi:hypothetical protein BT69DRAFT_1344386 [Atractiella rhizophila]|nr:hypothetical protein BT69DRAFT_1344386 [Atractiella rhizophila]
MAYLKLLDWETVWITDAVNSLKEYYQTYYIVTMTGETDTSRKDQHPRKKMNMAWYDPMIKQLNGAPVEVDFLMEFLDAKPEAIILREDGSTNELDALSYHYKAWKVAGSEQERKFRGLAMDISAIPC